MLNLQAIFEGLRTSGEFPDRTSFCAKPVPGADSFKVGTDKEGQPALLILASSGDVSSLSIRLKNLEVVQNVKCRVRVEGKSEMESFTILRCLGSGRELQSYFFRALEALIVHLGMQPTASNITEGINWLVELFRAQQKPPSTSIRGLWGELFVILNSSNPILLLEAWHQDPNERHDFSLQAARLEVKTFAQERIHHFSLNQLTSAPGEEVIVCSFRVEPSSSGKCIGDLKREITELCIDRSDLLLHLEQSIVRALGADWILGLERKFDVSRATGTIAYYHCSTIPSVPLPLPPAISNVRFQVDLTNIERTDIGNYDSTLFQSLPYAQS